MDPVIVEGLAQSMVTGDVPEILRGRRLGACGVPLPGQPGRILGLAGLDALQGRDVVAGQSMIARPGNNELEVPIERIDALNDGGIPCAIGPYPESGVSRAHLDQKGIVAHTR